ncbi:MAG TPA: fumarylacetoacetate hydrolase [Bacteroidetes bacterium]|nr:fumarylacetoacetate hydrolase [Bacteroidota bacterium]
MKLVSYFHPQEEQDRLGLLQNGLVYDMRNLDWQFPDNMQLFLYAWDDVIELALDYNQRIAEGRVKHAKPMQQADLKILAPVPHPNSCRDGYAFRQHVEAARRNRKVPMIPEFDQYPIFYFTNHNSIQGEGEIVCMPDHFQKLDFELESAIVICRQGKNIIAEEADNFIGGYMIMNDMSARTLQMEEMLLNLGPAKGKDFCTVIGPMLVTPDELEPYKIPAKENHVGNCYNLEMKCWVNGKLVSEGNMGSMDWTFAEIIERASYGVDLHPGDVIGSGTVGTGCFLELNGTGKLNDPNYAEQWLQPGDVIDMEITGLGKLTNTIAKADTEYSILAKKKVN